MKKPKIQVMKQKDVTMLRPFSLDEEQETKLFWEELEQASEDEERPNLELPYI